LNEDIKAAFERVAKEYDARADAAKQQRDRELTERQQFEAGFAYKETVELFPRGAVNELVRKIAQGPL
jgi:hypothetical protein